MVYLALSIFFSSLIYVLFSLIGQRKLQLLPCLIINYFFASACAIANFIRVDELFRITWWPAAIGIGVLFISIFIVMAKTTQQLGLATASVASKMSLVVPVIVALLFFNERLYFLKFAGLVLGIISVVLISYRKKQGEKLGPNNWKLPLILFLGSGVIDSLLKLTEHYFFKANPSNLFIASVFFLAGLFGLCYLLIFEKTKAKNLKNPQGIIFGGILGAVNFGSIFFLLQSLSLPNMEASVIFPINNVGIVALSSLFGLVLFKQKLGTIKFFGLLCAVTAVLLLSI